MLRLTRRADSAHWQIVGTLRGVRVRESTGTDSRPHAEAVLAKRQQEILDRAIYGERATATWVEAVNLYLDKGGEGRYLHALVKRWGVQPLTSITELEIARAGRELYPNAKPATVRRQLYTPVIAVLSCAAEAGLCTRPKIRGPKVRRTVVTEAPDDWVVALLTSPPRTPLQPGSKGERRWQEARAKLRAGILLMTLHGVRISEAVDLEWRDLDLVRGRALIRHPKGDQPRMLTLAPELIEALSALPRGRDRVLGYGSRYSLRMAIERTASAAGLPHYSSHSIGRHAFAARMLDAGHTLKDVQEGGGWADIGIVARHYGHRERAAVDRAVADAGTKLTRAIANDGTKVLNFKIKPKTGTSV